MSIKEIGEKVAEQTAAIFEKSTEVKYFLHFFCLITYFEIALHLFTQKTLMALSWSQLEALSPGTILAIVLGYFSLLGYFFTLLYSVAAWAVSKIASSTFFHQGQLRWSQLQNYVSEDEILEKAYTSKDYEPVRMLEEHQKQCKREQKKLQETAYLSFAALILSLLSYFTVPDSLLIKAFSELAAACGTEFMWIALVACYLPLMFLIWLDNSDDYEQQRYIRHPQIYQELSEEREKARDKRLPPTSY